MKVARKNKQIWYGIECCRYFLIRCFFPLPAGFKKQLEPLGVVTSTISHLNTLTTIALNMEPTTQVPFINITEIFVLFLIV
jgi:hypothetical protein